MSSLVTIFTMHEDPSQGGDGLRLLRHGFSWAAFWFGPCWLAAARLWARAGVALMFDLLVMASVGIGWLGLGAGAAIAGMAHWLIGLEGVEWRRAALARRGSPIVGLAFGDSEVEALAGARWPAGIEVAR